MDDTLQPLTLLLVEDNPDDAKLILRELKHAGFDAASQRVDTQAEFLEKLDGRPDIILSDYALPAFDGLRALELLKQSGRDIPFILISGTIGEDIAVDAIKRGADDYLLKDRLTRLGPAVKHALEQARLRREHQQDQEALRTTHSQLHQLLEHSPAVLYALKIEGKTIIPYLVSENITELLGFTVPETLHYEWWLGQLHPEDRDRILADFSEALKQNSSVVEYRLRHMDGTYRWVEDKRRLVRDSSGQPREIVGIWADITQRKNAEKVLHKISRQETEHKNVKVLWELGVIFGLAVLVEAFAYFTDVLEPPLEKLLLKFKDNLDDLFAPSLILLLGFLIFSYRRWKDTQSKVSAQANIEEALRTLHGELEKRIQQRTTELTRTNDSLLAEITERQRAEEALHQSQNHLRIVTENAHVGLVTINRERRYSFANGAYAEILGLPSADIVGQRIADVLAPLYEEQIRSRLDRAFAGERVAYELRKPAADGDCFYAVKYEPTKVDDAVSLVVVVITDITDEKRSQDELTAKTAFLEAQVDSSLDAILVVDNDAKVILKNQRLFQVFKIPDEIARDDDDNKMLQYVTGQIKDPKQFLQRVQYLYEHPDEIGRDEIELTNGTILDRYSSPVRDQQGKYYGRIWNFRDITENRKLEAQFRQAQKMEGIGQLAGGVAHDFNNILAVILMQSELMKGSGGLSAEQAGFAEEIEVTVQRAAALTRQLLLFSRREVFQPRDLDLSASIAGTTKMLTRVLGENIQIQLKLASQPMFIHADAGMMDQVLLNLTVNARDAMPAGGRLVIETSAVEFDEFVASQATQVRPGSFVCLSVSDSGTGIPPEVLPKIFEPFFTTKDVGKGTGLGLATVFGIVQQHQGWINVYSELNRGTIFRIYLPRLARKGGAKSSAPALADIRGGIETILLVEDDLSLRLSVRKTLSRLGYRILEAPTGVKALEVWKENRGEIRLLLTDLVMPDGMTGIVLAERILQDNPKLKVIYMSGYSAEVVGKDFPLQEGVNFLAKPFEAAKLVRTIRESLDAKSGP